MKYFLIFNNLFSIFDPSTLFFSMNWFSMMIFMLIMPQLFWMKYSRLIYLFKMIYYNLFNEFKLIMKNKFNLINMFYVMILFMFIMFNNFLGLFPYIFTASSHMVFSLMFSLSMWLAFMFFGWFKNFNYMFIHLVPMGTPFMLMFFMVVIELLSNIIRPLTLSIRLVANMIAGHLLLVLLSSFIENLMFIYFLMFMLQVMLLVLEVMVSIIQSYVFSILLILYLKETN